MAEDESLRRFGREFDRVAEEYDRVRPGYPDELVEAALAAGGLGVGARVVEVGCGTGKLTQTLAARGLKVEAVDPGASMLAFAQRRVGVTDAVRFHLSTFEELDLPLGAFDAVFSATAFHWVDPAVGWRKAASLLRPGGLLALLQYMPVWDKRTEHSDAELLAVRKRHVPEIAASFLPAPRRVEAILSGAMERSGNVSEVWSWIGPHDLSRPEAATLFEHVQAHGIPHYEELTAEQLLAHLRTTSLHQRLQPHLRDKLEADDRQVIERHGGKIGSSQIALLVTARRSTHDHDQPGPG